MAAKINEARRRRADSEAFWRFSLVFYGEPGVAEALIALQDRRGCDVNLVLFSLWLAVTRCQVVDAAGLAAAEAAAAPLRDAVIAELRRLRRRLRPVPDPDIQALRQRIGALEIAAERLVQARLTATLPAPRTTATADRGAIAAANLAACLGAASAAPEAETLRRALDRFIRGR